MKRFLWLLFPCGLISAVISAGMADINIGPRPEIRVVRTITRGAQQTYLLEVVNPTQRDLEYWGYGSGCPMYQMKTLDSGQWRDAMLGWCGTGVTPQRLPAHGSQKFEVTVRDAPSQVGLLLLPPNYERGKVFQFEWLPFSMRAKAVKWQNQRLDDKISKRMVWSARLEPLPPVAVLTTQVTQRPHKGGLP